MPDFRTNGGMRPNATCSGIHIFDFNQRDQD